MLPGTCGPNSGVEALHDVDLQELNEGVYGEWRRTVTAIIRDGQDAGELRSGDPVLLANALIGMIDGLSLQVLVGSRSMTPDRMRAVCDEVLAGMTAPPLAPVGPGGPTPILHERSTGP